VAPVRWSSLSDVERYVEAAPHLNYTLRNVRVLARGVRNGLEVGELLPPGIPDAVAVLAEAVADLPRELADSSDHGVVEQALDASRTANASLGDDMGLTCAVVVSQVDAIAVDVLRTLGVKRPEAYAHVRDVGV
jgi:hypothetical protein